MLIELKKGNKIYIKPKNRGKFTKYCHGKVTDECILKGKNSSNPTIRKRATFADNARKWKHQNGGLIFKGLEGLGNKFWNFLYKTGIGSKGDFKRMKSDLVNLGILQDNSENPNQLIGAPTILPGTRMNNVILMEKEAPTMFKMIAENPEKMKELLKEYKELYKYRGGSNEYIVKPFNGLARKIKTFLNTGDKNLLKEMEDWAKRNKYILVNKKEAEITPKGFLTAPDREKPIDYISREVQAKPMSDKLWDIITPEGWDGYIDRIITTSYKKGGIIKANEGTKFNFGLKVGNFLNSDWGKLIGTGIQSIGSAINLNKLISSQAAASKAQNQIDFNLMQYLLAELARKDNNDRYMLWIEDYQSGKTLDNPSTIVARSWNLNLNNQLALNKEQLKLQNKLIDMLTSALKANNFGNAFGSIVSTGVGMLGNYLSNKNNKSKV